VFGAIFKTDLQPNGAIFKACLQHNGAVFLQPNILVLAFGLQSGLLLKNFNEVLLLSIIIKPF